MGSQRARDVLGVGLVLTSRLALTFALLLAPSIASAADAEGTPTPAGPAAGPPAPAAAPPIAAAEAQGPTRGTDYTVPMIATDLALTGLLAGSWTLGRADAIPTGAAVGGVIGSYAAFAASGALYHAMFDVRKRTGMSLVVRLLAPATFGLIGFSSVHNSESKQCEKKGISRDDCDHDGAEIGALVGTMIGMLGATVADATIMARDGQKAPPPPPPPPVTVAPTAGAVRGGATVGLVATF